MRMKLKPKGKTPPGTPSYYIDIADVVQPRITRSPSFAKAYPEAAQMWDYKRNCGFGPEDFSYGSTVCCWFKCPEGPDHSFQSQLKTMSRAARGETWSMGCGFCHGLKTSVTNNLADKYPKIAKQWMVRKNGLGPSQVSYGSDKIAWWKCTKGHEWKATVYSRTICDCGCPKCNRAEPIDLRDYPKVLKEFDTKKNRGLDPRVLPNSARVFWICTINSEHKWQSRYSRTTKGIRCPYCTNKKGSKGNNLQQSHSEVAKLWHPDKNGGRKPTDVTATSHHRVWWKCKRAPDHEWQATIRNCVKAKYHCPFCSYQLASITNAIATVVPQLAKEWHPTLNDKKPTEVTSGSNYRAWWKCDKGPDHEWQAQIADRVHYATECPFCTFRKTSVTNVISTQAPHLVAEWHIKKNGKVTPANERIRSTKPRWWVCSECSHEWQATPRQRLVNGSSCPRCAKLAALEKCPESNVLKKKTSSSSA
jgi:hypothetical protein